MSRSYRDALFCICRRYTALAEAIPNPRVIDLNTLTTVGGEMTHQEYEASRIISNSADSHFLQGVSESEIMEELEDFPQDVINYETDGTTLRDAVLGSLNRTATLLQERDLFRGERLFSEHSDIGTDDEIFRHEDIYPKNSQNNETQKSSQNDESPCKEVDQREMDKAQEDGISNIPDSQHCTIHQVFTNKDEEEIGSDEEIFHVTRQQVKRKVEDFPQDANSGSEGMERKKRKT